MRAGPLRVGFTEGEVEARLTDAGRVLLALPWAGCFPCGFRSLWPETEPSGSRRRPPSAPQIDAMDEAYCWTSLIVDQDERRLVLMRSLVLPMSPHGTPRFVYSWRRLGRITGLHADTLKKRWGRGIGHIVTGLNRADARSVHGKPGARFGGV